MSKPLIRCFYAIELSCVECPWRDHCEINKQYYTIIKDLLQLANEGEMIRK